MNRSDLIAIWSRLAPKQTDQGIQVGGQKILAAEIADSPLFVLAVFAIGLDEADVFVLDPLAAARLDDA